MKNHHLFRLSAVSLAIASVLASTSFSTFADSGGEEGRASRFTSYQAPAGDLPTTREVMVDGVRAAVLPNGRLLTPAGVEVSVDAPKPFGMALSPDGQTLATINSGASRFSVTLLRNLAAATPSMQRVDINATFMGVVFSPDSKRFYVAGGENGNIWIGDTAQARIIGSVNLNGATHPLDRPLHVTDNPKQRFKGSFPGNMALSLDGRWLYVVDQGAFQVHVIDTTKIVTGTDALNRIAEPDNFAAVAGRTKVGRYPFGINLSEDEKSLYVTHVGVFQYTHLRPANPTGDDNLDYPLCYPGAGYPGETANDRTIAIKKVDARNLPDTLRDPAGIRCGYVPNDISYKVPGLGNPNVPESSSVYVLDVATPATPTVKNIVKTGPQVGEREDGIAAYSGSHPNSVAIGAEAIYVANGNNDSISVLRHGTRREIGRIQLSLLEGYDRKLKGLQPVALSLSPDNKFLYVAEAGINAVGVIKLDGKSGKVTGHIPTGWWPASIQVSADGRTLYVANARGRGSPPTLVSDGGSPKHSVLGSVSIIPVPSESQLEQHTKRVYVNNGFIESDNGKIAKHGKDGRDDDRDDDKDESHPIPHKAGVASKQIKHVIFINKENATHDLLLGDIIATRRGVPVNGSPAFSLGYDASPNHHELALGFAFSDNFYLEPSVSSDGHRWLTNTYTTEFEETHWPASYGGKRRDSGDDPEVFKNYPGRIGFTDANSSPEPNDYNQHGGIYMHLHRNGKSFVNFGNGFEFALIDEPFGVDPTGARMHANVPMEKVVRDNSDHLFPTYNTHIPDAPLPEDPSRFSRFGRFKQVFESRFVDRKKDECNLPNFTDLYYPNDHGGGANHINPTGAPWSFKRYVQDNDAALGLTVELIANSPCWKDTVIFVVEDDTQNGMDHVDGHRSIFLAISPWVKREYVSKTHTSLSSIFKTIDLILGIPPLNQYDAAATDLRDMFTSKADLKPYQSQNILYAKGASKTWIAMTKVLDFNEADAEEVNLREAIMKSENLPRKPRKK